MLHSFGIKADVKDNICYLDEQTVIYPSGHNIVIFNTEQKTQKFIPGTENTEGITAMAVSPNHKYVAVAEKAKEGEKAQVTIFDLHTLKRRKVRMSVTAVASAAPPYHCVATLRRCSSSPREATQMTPSYVAAVDARQRVRHGCLLPFGLCAGCTSHRQLTRTPTPLAALGASRRHCLTQPPPQLLRLR